MADLVSELSDNALRVPVRKRAEEHVEPRASELRRVVGLEDEIGISYGEARIEIRRASARLGISRHMDDVELRMSGTQSQQFDPGVSRGAEHADPGYRKISRIGLHEAKELPMLANRCGGGAKAG